MLMIFVSLFTALIIKIVDRRLIISFFTLICFGALSQKNDTSMLLFRHAERDLADIQQQAFHSRNEQERTEGNKEFIAAWDRIVQDPRILDYQFTLLKDVSILQSSDRKVKLITWNLHR